MQHLNELSRLAVFYVEQRHALGVINHRTFICHRSVLNTFVSSALHDQPALLSIADVESWMTSRRHRAPTTVAMQFSVNRGFCDWLVEEGQLDRNPFAKVKPPRVPKGLHRNLGADQVGALLAVCENEVDELIVQLCVQLGLRRAEVAGMDIADVDWIGRSVRIAGKGGHIRDVPLTIEAERVLSGYLDRRGRWGWLIPSPARPGKPISASWVGQRITTLAWRAGLKRAPHDGVSTHALRHTAATDVWRRTHDLLAVKEFLGHSSVATTEIYVAGLDREKLREAIDGRVYRAVA